MNEWRVIQVHQQEEKMRILLISGSGRTSISAHPNFHLPTANAQIDFLTMGDQIWKSTNWYE